jgi:mycofactocin system glycosyltransferase
VTEQRSGRRFRLDGSVQQFGNVVIGGSPLKLFRVTDAGVAAIGSIAAGDAVAPSQLVDALLDGGAIHPLPDLGTAWTAEDVTIVVPTLGRPAAIPPGAIVVDDGSPVPVAGAQIRLDRNSGPGAARNAGLALVTTPLVAFVDADVTLPEGWLDGILHHFDDERVAAVAPRVSTSGVGPRASGRLHRYEVTASPLDLGAEPARVRAGTRVSYVPAAVLVCRTDVIRSLGGFDSSLRFGEDVDLVWRLDDAGWRVRYEPSAVVHHAPRATASAWVHQRIGYGSSAAPLARRHAGALAPLRMSGWSLAAWALAALGRPISGVVVGVGSAAALVRKLPDVPPRDAFRLAAVGNLHAGEQIGFAIRRTWWPLLAVAAMRSTHARRLLVAAAIAGKHPLRLADDVAYSLGVWKGMLTERTFEPLVPEISSWPGRSAGRPAPTATVR